MPEYSTFSAPLRDKLRYPRLRKDTGTVLMLDAGYFIQQECLNGFRRLGWKVALLQVDPPETFINRLLEAVLLHKPDLLFTVNHLGFDQPGELTRLLKAMEMPFVSWFVDSPAYILLNHRANASEYAVTPVWERSYIPFLKEFGFENTFHLPLAGDPGVFNTGIQKQNLRQECLSYLVGFVGDSMGRAAAKWRALCPEFPGRDEYLDRAAQSLLSDRRTEVLNKVLPGLDETALQTLRSAMVLQATLTYRKEIAGQMRGMETHYFGDDGWADYLPESAILHPRADYYTELPAIYRNTAVNLNSTSFQMPTAVNQRVFDVPLAGGFLLTDRQPDLDELFDRQNEVATYTDPLELPQLVKFYLSRPDLRERMIRKARGRILAEHTYPHRLSRVIEAVRKKFGGVQSVKCKMKNVKCKMKNAEWMGDDSAKIHHHAKAVNS